MLTPFELSAALLHQAGDRLDADARAELFRAMDTNGDGVVDLKEFWAWYRRKAQDMLVQQQQIAALDSNSTAAAPVSSSASVTAAVAGTS